MRQYILKRLVLAIPTLIGVSLIVFFMVRLIPGDVVEQIAGDAPPTPEFRAQIEEELGLDKPEFYVMPKAGWPFLEFHSESQYVIWLADVVTLDFGKPLRGSSGESVNQLLKDKLPVTIEMSLLALIVSLIIAVPVGIISAVRQDTIIDYVARSTAIGFLALPTFWLGTLIINYASNWFTASTPVPREYREIWESPFSNIEYLVFPFGNFVPVGPAIILGVSLSGTVMRLMRAQMLEVLRQDYVRTAWAKGLRERTVVTGHALKNALIPVVTVVGLQVPILISGSVVVESIYNVPGMGQQFFLSIGTRDYTVVQSIALIIAVSVVLSNLIVDITYAYLDPRIRYS
jgi:peptide/nickel transport system permease protein